MRNRIFRKVTAALTVLCLFPGCTAEKTESVQSSAESVREPEAEESIRTVVFFGDSITRGIDFEDQFENIRIVNMGQDGDTLQDLIMRSPMIADADPDQVFLMGGINGMTDDNSAMMLENYRNLLEAVTHEVPDAEIYVQSVLPIADYRENTWSYAGICSNAGIRSFNANLEQLAAEHKMIYIDLYSVYEQGGSLNPAYTEDGIHIYGHYGPWAETIRPYIEK